MENLGICGRIIRKWIFKKSDGDALDWIDMAQHRERWHVLVYAVMNLQVL
jgi:hypothetical protein